MPTMLTSKQAEASRLLARVRNLLLYGSAGSGKTWFAITALVSIACRTTAWGLVARRYATDVRASIWNNTLPAVLRAHGFKNGIHYKLNEQQMTCTFTQSGGVIALAGLDDRERVDKLLGQEYSIIYVNECSDVPWQTINILKTRLRQSVKGLDNRFIADLNPTSDAHWSYKLWHLGVHPETRDPLRHPEDYGFLQMNSGDNAENLPAEYIDELSNLVGNARERFYSGNYQSTTGLRVFSPTLYQWPEFVAWSQGREGSMQFIAGLDLGYQDADAFVILAHCPGDQQVWIVYEHKARRESVDDLVAAIREGLAWVRHNIPARDHHIRIYSETATLRYGHEGDDKKSWSMLKEMYGLPVERAYKRDKKLGVELLQDMVNAGRLMVPRGGPFADECDQTVWTREIDGTIVRRIDDDTYHPDEMDAILYPLRELWSYGGDEHKQLPPPPPSPDPPTDNEVIEAKWHSYVDRSQEVW
jgi:PBSX family phage terminase large subunit